MLRIAVLMLLNVFVCEGMKQTHIRRQQVLSRKSFYLFRKKLVPISKKIERREARREVCLNSVYRLLLLESVL